jgi:hypothetical protein
MIVAGKDEMTEFLQMTNCHKVKNDLYPSSVQFISQLIFHHPNDHPRRPFGLKESSIFENFIRRPLLQFLIQLLCLTTVLKE